MKKGTRSARYLYPFGGLTSTVPGLRLNRQLSSTVAILLVLFCGLSAHAQSITISHIDGASSFTSVLNSEGIRNNWTVYGGIAGAVNAGACADRSSTNTCNNCDEYGEPCNRRRIHPNLYLTVYYSTSQIDGRFLITDEEGDIALSDTGTQVIPRGEVNFARVTWSKLCETIGANSDCSTNATGRVRVGVDATTSSTGGSSEGADDQRLNHSSDRYIDISIRVYAPTASGDYPFHEDCDNENIALCNFTVFPGDEKVFVTRIQEGVEGFPETGGGIGFRKVLFFCGEGTSTVDVTAGFAKIDSAKEVCGEMEIITDSDGSYAIDPDFIDDLENEKYYYFRMAVEDNAGNIGYFTPPGMNEVCLKDSQTDCHYAKPSEVLGALSEDVNCFISTAAYNSPLNTKVTTFREFRNRFLLTNRVGSSLVDAYYQHGPKAARWMNQNHWVKPFVRMALWPVWGLAQLSLKWGLLTAALSFMALPLTLIAVLRRRPLSMLFRRRELR